jgi:hypothetical protein
MFIVMHSNIKDMTVVVKEIETHSISIDYRGDPPE